MGRYLTLTIDLFLKLILIEMREGWNIYMNDSFCAILKRKMNYFNVLSLPPVLPSAGESAVLPRCV